MADPRDPDEGGGDLFDRWLAHREETEEEAPRPRTYGVPRTARGEEELPAPTPAPEPEAKPEHEPTPEPAPPVRRERVAEPVGEPARRQPVSLEEFEPVVIASVRRAAEAPEEPTRSRLSRARRRPPVEQPTEQTEPMEPHEETATAEPIVEEPVAAEPTAPEPDPPTPERSAAAEVFAAFNTDLTPGGGHTSEPRPETDRPATTEPKERPARRLPSLTSYVQAARTALDRSVRGTPEERVHTTPATAAPPPTSVDAPRTSEVERDPALTRSAYDELRAQREAAVPPSPDVLPPSIDFRPRTGARLATSVLLLLGLAATGVAAWRAYDSRVETDIGLAAILALFTGVVWAVRAGTVPTRVSLHGGHLEVRTQAGRFVFELTSEHTTVEMVGTPGRPGWRVLIHRRGLSPFVITRSMVDPHDLTDALRYYRPDL